MLPTAAPLPRSVQQGTARCTPKRVRCKRRLAQEADSEGHGMLHVCLSAVERLGLRDTEHLTLLEKTDLEMVEKTNLEMAKHGAGAWLSLPPGFGCAQNTRPPVGSCQ